MSKKFITTVGVEYTFIVDPDQKFIDDDKVFNAFVAKESNPSKWIKKNAHQDDHCVEVPTPVCADRAMLKRYYRELTGYARQFPVVNWHHTEPSGGGHIHLGVKEHVKKKYFDAFVRNVYTEMTDHPELNWAVNCPTDNVNANSLTHHYDTRSAASYNTSNYYDVSRAHNTRTLVLRDTVMSAARRKKCSATETTQVRLSYYDIALGATDYVSSRHAVAYREGYGTLEFRVFDSPRDWTEQELFLDIALAIYAKCLTAAKSGVTFEFSKMTPKKMRDTTFAEAWRNFREHLKSLGIDPNRAHNQKSNMLIRFGYGMNYLK